MIEFIATLEQFGKFKEKSGWTFIAIKSTIAKKITEQRTTFRVKGSLDDLEIKQVALVPMGDGDFILPVNATMRKRIKKSQGDQVKVKIELDPSELLPDQDFMDCLAEVPKALEHYLHLSQSHKNYFTKWLDTARTQATKAERIALAINALSRGLRFNQMLREKAGKPF